MLNVIRNINLATTMAGGTALTDVTGGLSLRWTYGGITGSKWTDLSGNGNHGYQSGSGTLTDSGSQYGYKFDGNLWFEVPTTTASLARNFNDATLSGFPGASGSTVIYYGLLISGSDQYLWNRSEPSRSTADGVHFNSGWGHVIGLEATQSSNRAPDLPDDAFGGFTTSTAGNKYSIQQLVDNIEFPQVSVNTPYFKGSWNYFPSSSAESALISSSFEGGVPVFVVFRNSYSTTAARFGVSVVQTNPTPQFELNQKPPNKELDVAFNSDPNSNKYIYSRNNFNKDNNNVAPVNFVMGKSQYYVSSSIGGYKGTMLETRLYDRELSDNEVYRVCNAIRLNLRVTGSFN
jgi:hypothetical protein